MGGGKAGSITRARRYRITGSASEKRASGLCLRFVVILLAIPGCIPRRDSSGALIGICARTGTGLSPTKTSITRIRWGIGAGVLGRWCHGAGPLGDAAGEAVVGWVSIGVGIMPVLKLCQHVVGSGKFLGVGWAESRAIADRPTRLTLLPRFSASAPARDTIATPNEKGRRGGDERDQTAATGCFGLSWIDFFQGTPHRRGRRSWTCR